MTTREDLLKDKEGVETILCALEGIGQEIPDKVVVRALARSLFHILEYLIRRIK